MELAFAKRLIAVAAMLAAVVACDRPATDQASAGAVATTPAAVQAPEVDLDDVIETTSDYVIGISYPQSAAKYPRLAAELKAYADEARAELMRAVEARRQSQPAGEGNEGSAMYDLSLTFTEVLDSPRLAAYAADGSMYTGGAHGMPLLARFVWVPQQQQLLTAGTLVPQAGGWEDIAGYVREQLHTALSQRIEADGLDPAERAEFARSAGRMIDDGTGVDPANFSQFEPVVGVDGRITAIRFVFPPYQVAPYSDGIQTAEVPASVLLPHVAPGYRDLFAEGAASGGDPSVVAAPEGSPTS